MADEQLNGQILAERYQIQRQLGKQIGRQTLLARDLQTQELAVVKLLFLGSDFEWQDLKLFQREAETLKALSHPAIPRYLDYLEIDEPDNKGFALVQSYVEGKTLEEHLNAGRTFSEAEVKELAKSLLEILIYLHECEPPVIHRDIKPSNILLANRSAHSVGEVYLVDFGSVQTLAAREGGTITVVGTYGYMPPEQFGGRATAASDLYSLGATLIYLVTGRHPTELPQKDFKIQFQQAAHVEKGLANWLEWMTEPSLERRLQSARSALQSLENPPPQITKNKKSSVVSKPPVSEVFLNKNPDILEIILPPKGWSFGTIALLSAAIPLIFGFGFGMAFPNNFQLSLLNIILLAGTVWALVVALFKRVRLRIDSQKISFRNEVFRWKWNRVHPAPREAIEDLAVIRGLGSFSVGDEEEILVAKRLIIRAGEQQYELGEKDGLSETELNWLARELSDWLGLPIGME